MSDIDGALGFRRALGTAYLDTPGHPDAPGRILVMGERAARAYGQFSFCGAKVRVDPTLAPEAFEFRDAPT